MRYALIGNSYAAVGAVEAIRSRDRDGEITIFSDEPYRVYARPLISYYLEGRVSSKDMYYRPKEFYEKFNLKLLSGKRVERVDTAKQQLYVDDNSVHDYDKLLVCTGSSPFVPPIKGIGAKNILGFIKWNDAEEILNLAKQKKKAIVVGGGLIGIKAAEGMIGLGMDVTIVEKGTKIFHFVLDEESGNIVNRRTREAGVKLITGYGPSEILADDKGDVCGIILENGERVSCDVLIIAIGVRPNVDLLKGSSVEINRGIVVDRCMKTSEDHVYAAGDVAEAWDLLNNKNSIIAISPLAYEQGMVAGNNMVGNYQVYHGGVAMNSTEVFKFSLITLGLTSNLSEDYEQKIFLKVNVYKKLVFKDNKLVGAILVNEVDYGGLLTHLIRSQVDIDEIKEELIDSIMTRSDFASLLPTVFNYVTNEISFAGSKGIREKPNSAEKLTSPESFQCSQFNDSLMNSPKTRFK